MKRLLGVPLVLLLAMTPPATALAGAPITVSGTQPWTATGMTLAQGTTYHVTANGLVQTAQIPRFLVPGVSKSASGPAGQTSGPACSNSFGGPADGSCTVEGAYFGELVGMIWDGTSAPVTFRIGAQTSFVAPASGQLYLSANDLNLAYYDNNGQFTVSISQG